LAEKFIVVFRDQRRHNGIARANLMKSVGAGLGSDTIVMAVSSDYSNQSATCPTPDRMIRHLYFAGCEVNISSGEVRGVGSLSSDSIFLIAQDLLGEYGRFWTAVKRFSDALHAVQRPAHPTRLSNWIHSNFITS